MSWTFPYELFPEADRTETVAILDRAFKRIENPERFTQKEYARDAEGNYVRVHDDKAVCWCSYGALDIEKSRRPSLLGEHKAASMFMRRASAFVWNNAPNYLKGTRDSKQKVAVVDVNDVLGHEYALRMLGRAIALAKGQDEN